VLIAESSMKSKIRINDYNNFRKYSVRRVVFDTSLLARDVVVIFASNFAIHRRVRRLVKLIAFLTHHICTHCRTLTTATLRRHPATRQSICQRGQLHAVPRELSCKLRWARPWHRSLPLRLIYREFVLHATPHGARFVERCSPRDEQTQLPMTAAFGHLPHVHVVQLLDLIASGEKA
jgi:hypothetical protein